MHRWWFLALFFLGACAAATNTSSDRAGKTQSSPTTPVASRAAASSTLNADLERLLVWFAGEWDNNEQVWQQKQVPEEQRTEPLSEHTHHLFAPVRVPALGEHAFFVEQYLDGDASKVYRRRLYRFSVDVPNQAVRLDIYSFKDDAAFASAHRKPELLTGLRMDALNHVPGCAVYWRYDASKSVFNGTMPKDACRYVSPRLKKELIVNDTLMLSASELWLDDQAKDAEGNPVFGKRNPEPIKNRKVRYFDGWAVINRAGMAAGPRDTKYRLIRPLRLHNEGQKVALTWEDGSPTGYTLELAQLTYQETRVPILKLALIDDASGSSVSYSWADTDAKRIGFNLKWFQAGFTLKEKNSSVGWD